MRCRLSPTPLSPPYTMTPTLMLHPSANLLHLTRSILHTLLLHNHTNNRKQSGKGYHPGALRAAEAFGLHLTNVAGAS